MKGTKANAIYLGYYCDCFFSQLFFVSDSDWLDDDEILDFIDRANDAGCYLDSDTDTIAYLRSNLEKECIELDYNKNRFSMMHCDPYRNELDDIEVLF